MTNQTTTLATTQERVNEIQRIQDALKSGSASRTLSAMGHPGYGIKFAAKALATWATNPGLSLHQVVYGMQGR